MILRVHYVDGATWVGTIQDWPTSPGEGVDVVEVQDPLGIVRFASQSLYWAYEENRSVVVGSGSVRYDHNPITEIVFSDGGQHERQREFMPDLPLRALKVGHWWPGTSAPCERRP
jgi:hypothetical protein